MRKYCDIIFIKLPLKHGFMGRILINFQTFLKHVENKFIENSAAANSKFDLNRLFYFI